MLNELILTPLLTHQLTQAPVKPGAFFVQFLVKNKGFLPTTYPHMFDLKRHAPDSGTILHEPLLYFTYNIDMV